MSNKKPKNIYLNVLSSRTILELLQLGYTEQEIISSFKLRGVWAQSVHCIHNMIEYDKGNTTELLSYSRNFLSK